MGDWFGKVCWPLKRCMFWPERRRPIDKAMIAANLLDDAIKHVRTLAFAHDERKSRSIAQELAQQLQQLGFSVAPFEEYRVRQIAESMPKASLEIVSLFEAAVMPVDIERGGIMPKQDALAVLKRHYADMRMKDLSARRAEIESTVSDGAQT